MFPCLPAGHEVHSPVSLEKYCPRVHCIVGVGVGACVGAGEGCSVGAGDGRREGYSRFDAKATLVTDRPSAQLQLD